MLVKAFEDELHRDRVLGLRLRRQKLLREFRKSGNGGERLTVLRVARVIRELETIPLREPVEDRLVAIVLELRLASLLDDIGEVPVEDRRARLSDEMPGDPDRAFLLALVDELDLPRDRRNDLAEVDDARHRLVAIAEKHSSLDLAYEKLARGDGKTRGDARSLVDVLRLAAHEGDLLERLGEESRDHHLRKIAVAIDPRLLERDPHRVIDRTRIMREDLRRDSIFERRDDASSIGVILRVRREHHEDIERKAQRKAADLHVALLEDVEEADLDARREVGKLVDRE